MAVGSRKKVTRRKPARRKSIAAPKRIINRKKSKTTRRKVTTAKVSAADRRAERQKEKIAAESALGAQMVDLVDKQGLTVAKAAKKAGVAVAKANRAYKTAKVNPRDRIVGTDAQVGKAIVRLRDKENLPWPEVRARTGLGGAKIRQLYEQSSGKSWRDSGTGAKRTTAKKATAKRATGRKKVVRAKKTTTKRAATKKATKKATGARKAGRPKVPSAGQRRVGPRRARKEANQKLLHDVIWDLDVMDKKTIASALEGKTVVITRELNGRPMRALDRQVIKVKDVKPSDRDGKLIEFKDDKAQTRFVAAREITALK